MLAKPMGDCMGQLSLSLSLLLFSSAFQDLSVFRTNRVETQRTESRVTKRFGRNIRILALAPVQEANSSKTCFTWRYTGIANQLTSRTGASALRLSSGLAEAKLVAFAETESRKPIAPPTAIMISVKGLRCRSVSRSKGDFHPPEGPHAPL